MNPYNTCLYTIKSKTQLDEVARDGTSFAFTINMPWAGAKAEFAKAKQAGEEYIALFSDAAQTDKIYHLGIVASIEVDKTTRIEFSKIMPVENEIWKSDLVKLSGGNISKNFIRPYSLCRTPDFSSFPPLPAGVASIGITKTYDFVTVPEVKEYVDGLKAIQPKMRAEHYRILQAHYQMPGHTANAKELAEAAAISDGYYRVNLLYGGLGHMFCDATGFVPDLRPDDSARWWAVWSVGHSTKDHGFLWQMRSQVVEALETLRWVKALISEETYRKKEQEETVKSLASTETERQTRLAVAPSHPAALQVLRTEFQRNPDVVASVLFRAQGRCELCETSAPFLRVSDGSAYLEIHHIVSLSKGGEDTLRNAVSLCPNCHREVHYGKERDRHNQSLQRIAEKSGSR